MKIKKRTGREEYFSQLKTYRSMIRAGATEKMSRKISHEIDYREGTTTADVRKNVLSIELFIKI